VLLAHGEQEQDHLLQDQEPPMPLDDGGFGAFGLGDYGAGPAPYDGLGAGAELELEHGRDEAAADGGNPFMRAGWRGGAGMERSGSEDEAELDVETER
jgi:hypothetical protein